MAEQRPDYGNWQLIKDLWKFIEPYRWRYLVATVLRLIGDVARLYPAYALAQGVNFLAAYESGEPLTLLWWYIGSAVSATILHVTCRQTAKYIGFQVAEKCHLDVQLRALRHLFLLDLAWHQRENSGNKVKRIQKGGEGISKILRMWLANFIEIGVNFVGITIILATVEPFISLAFIGYIVSYYLLSLFFTKHASAMAHRVNVEEEQLHGLAFESVSNIRSVKVLGMGSSLAERVQEQMQNVFRFIKKRVFWFSSRYLALDVFSALFNLGVLIVIALGVVHGRYEVGFLVLYINYFRKITENINELAMVTLDFVIAKFGISRLTDILAEPVRIDVQRGKQPFPEQWDAITVQNVSFAYGEGGEESVLRDISFTIKRGEKVGIVGASGAGKSTLFKLLLKEHEDYDGTVHIGSVPLRDIRRSDFFQHAAVVLQETEVFSFRLAENITLGNPDEASNEALLQKAVQTAHVHDFLHKLPQGLQTRIGEKGVKLSGGEKQRVGIARAIFKQPDILFLDEATSHLDVESEEKIQDSLHNFFREVTAVVIAHRLSTIKEMDRIIVIEDGVIREQGSFNALLETKGRFYELWQKGF